MSSTYKCGHCGDDITVDGKLDSGGSCPTCREYLCHYCAGTSCSEVPLTLVHEVSDHEVVVDGTTYWCPSGGGCVRLGAPGRPGDVYGKQVCDGLNLTGETLRVNCDERLLGTILRELPDHRCRRLIVVEPHAPGRPQMRWWGEVANEELEFAADGWRIEHEDTMWLTSDGWLAPLTRWEDSNG